MFRRYQNPLQQGTDVLPNVLQAPPVVRIGGVQDGSLEANQLIGWYAPIIHHFLRSQRQNQEISGLNHVRITRRFDDGAVTYTRLYGQETLVVHLRPDVLRSLLQKRSVIYDTILLGYITVSAGSADYTYPYFLPYDPDDPLNALETPLTATLNVGNITYTDTAVATFGRSVQLSVYLYESFEEHNYVGHPSNGFPGGGGFLSPYPNNNGYVTFWEGTNFFPFTPTEGEALLVNTQNKPREYYYQDASREGRIKYVRALASTAGVSMRGKIPCGGSLSITGTAENFFEVGGPRKTDLWPARMSVSGQFYPRNPRFMVPYQRTWRGYSTKTTQRYSHTSYLIYTGDKGFFVDGVRRKELSASWIIDVSDDLVPEMVRDYHPQSTAYLGFVDV